MDIREYITKRLEALYSRRNDINDEYNFTVEERIKDALRRELCENLGRRSELEALEKCFSETLPPAAPVCKCGVEHWQCKCGRFCRNV